MPPNPRRTSRRLKDAAEVKEVHVVANSGPSTPDEIKARWASKEGVERTMRELGEMEAQLQNATRRQRLAVESSELSIDREPPRIFQPSPIYSHKSVVNQKAKEQPTEVEKAPQDDYDAEMAQGDLVSIKNEDEAAERGAARPPPVNSEVLPLPWKGRLGYVSTSQEQCLHCTDQFLTIIKGMPKYIFAQLDPSRILLENLQDQLHHRTPTPTP